MIRRQLVLLSIFVLIQGSNCSNPKNTLPGTVYEMSDAALTTCDPYPGVTGHQCLLISNPERGILRVFDATEKQFVLSKTGYASLAVRAGSLPTLLAVYNNQAYVLDAADQSILNIPLDTLKKAKIVPTNDISTELRDLLTPPAQGVDRIIKDANSSRTLTLNSDQIAGYIFGSRAAVLTANGNLQIIDLTTMKAADPVVVSSKIAGTLPGSLGRPIKIIGATIDKEKKLFLIYTNFIGVIDEAMIDAKGDISKIDLIALR